MQEEHAKKNTHRHQWLVLALLMIVFIGIVFVCRITKSTSLLPNSVVSKINGFVPYFYKKDIPNGYSLDEEAISLDHDVLMIPLITKPDSPTVVLTEQLLPSGLSQQDIQQNGEAVSGTVVPATINTVEGRLVGTMVAKTDHTLILLNAPATVDKNDIVALIQGLQRLR